MKGVGEFQKLVSNHTPFTIKNGICESLNALSTLVLTIKHILTNLCQSNIPLRKKQLQFIVAVAIMNKTCQDNCAS